MGKQTTIEKELEDLISIHENGGGFGDPDAKAEHERKIQYLSARSEIRAIEGILLDRIKEATSRSI